MAIVLVNTAYKKIIYFLNTKPIEKIIDQFFFFFSKKYIEDVLILHNCIVWLQRLFARIAF